MRSVESITQAEKPFDLEKFKPAERFDKLVASRHRKAPSKPKKAEMDEDLISTCTHPSALNHLSPHTQGPQSPRPLLRMQTLHFQLWKAGQGWGVVWKRRTLGKETPHKKEKRAGFLQMEMKLKEDQRLKTVLKT